MAYPAAGGAGGPAGAPARVPSADDVVRAERLVAIFAAEDVATLSELYPRVTVESVTGETPTAHRLAVFRAALALAPAAELAAARHDAPGDAAADLALACPSTEDRLVRARTLFIEAQATLHAHECEATLSMKTWPY